VERVGRDVKLHPLTLLPVRSQACAEYVMAPIDRDGVRLVDWIDSLTPRKKYCTREADRCKRDLHFTHVLVLGSELRPTDPRPPILQELEGHRSSSE
jgi:hypothetical protein